MTEVVADGVVEVFCRSKLKKRILEPYMDEFSLRTQAAHETVFAHQLEGWVGHRIWQMVDFANHFQVQNDIYGDVLEIGVHHGKLLFILASAARERERITAVDVFENQKLNLDNSGCGSLAAFQSNMRELFPALEERCDIISRDSVSIPLSQARELLAPRGIRIMSVDGGHTIAHVIHDLGLAQEIVVSGGIVLLDDFLGPHWPSVTEGFFKFMAERNSRLAPLMIFQNKLFLTTYSEHQAVLDGLHQWLESTAPGELPSKWKCSQLCGFRVLGHSP